MSDDELLKLEGKSLEILLLDEQVKRKPEEFNTKLGRTVTKFSRKRDVLLAG